MLAIQYVLSIALLNLVKPVDNALLDVELILHYMASLIREAAGVWRLRIKAWHLASLRLLLLHVMQLKHRVH